MFGHTLSTQYDEVVFSNCCYRLVEVSRKIYLYKNKTKWIKSGAAYAEQGKMTTQLIAQLGFNEKN